MTLKVKSRRKKSKTIRNKRGGVTKEESLKNSLSKVPSSAFIVLNKVVEAVATKANELAATNEAAMKQAANAMKEVTVDEQLVSLTGMIIKGKGNVNELESNAQLKKIQEYAQAGVLILNNKTFMDSMVEDAVNETIKYISSSQVRYKALGIYKGTDNLIRHFDNITNLEEYINKDKISDVGRNKELVAEMVRTIANKHDNAMKEDKIWLTENMNMTEEAKATQTELDDLRIKRMEVKQTAINLGIQAANAKQAVTEAISAKAATTSAVGATAAAEKTAADAALAAARERATAAETEAAKAEAQVASAEVALATARAKVAGAEGATGAEGEAAERAAAEAEAKTAEEARLAAETEAAANAAEEARVAAEAAREGEEARVAAEAAAEEGEEARLAAAAAAAEAEAKAVEEAKAAEEAAAAEAEAAEAEKAREAEAAAAREAAAREAAARAATEEAKTAAEAAKAAAATATTGEVNLTNPIRFETTTETQSDGSINGKTKIISGPVSYQYKPSSSSSTTLGGKKRKTKRKTKRKEKKRRHSTKRRRPTRKSKVKNKTVIRSRSKKQRIKK